MSAGAKRAVDVLLSALRAGRLHHAVMLYGADLGELEETAKTVSREILASENLPHNPDFFELRPEGKARNIRIGSDSDRVGGEWPPNSMRWLLHVLRESAHGTRGKVALIYEADRMNVPTANAFLKTLEEPPRDTFMFLLTQRPNDLLDTIKSRCVQMRVDCPPRPLEDEEWAQWLESYAAWIKYLSEGAQRGRVAEAFMRGYALVNSFNLILSRLSDAQSDIAEDKFDEMDEELVEAALAGERRSLRKRMLMQIEDITVSAALENYPSVSASRRLSRAVAELEKCASFMELNMADAAAFEYFMLSSIKIWSAKI